MERKLKTTSPLSTVSPSVARMEDARCARQASPGCDRPAGPFFLYGANESARAYSQYPRKQYDRVPRVQWDDCAAFFPAVIGAKSGPISECDGFASHVGLPTGRAFPLARFFIDDLLVAR
jgi:cellulase/cellobiase CelA1